MGKLTGQDLEYIHDHILNYHRLARKDRLWFQFKNSQEGQKGHNILKRVYAEKYVTSGDVGNYTDFNMKFTNEAAATWVLDDLDSSISAYQSYHPEVHMGGAAGESSGNGAVAGTGGSGDEPEKKSVDWTTYIIIGAAAVAIILLLFGKKKKK